MCAVCEFSLDQVRSDVIKTNGKEEAQQRGFHGTPARGGGLSFWAEEEHCRDFV